jgi:hypothetical protein
VYRDGTLSLAQEILRAHFDKIDAGALELIPVTHEDLESDHALLRSAVEHYGGSYIDCSPMPSGPAYVEAGIRPEAASLLEALCRARGLHVKIAFEDDRVRVQNVDGTEPTGSMLTVHGVLSALASNAIDRELVVFSYPLEGLDRTRAALLWDATLAVATFPPVRLRSFFPIAVGPVDIDAHCGRVEGSVRFVVRGGQLTRRKTDFLIADRISQILDRRDRKIVIFAGAGASASARVPQGNHYRDLALQTIVGTSSSPELRFREWLEENKRWRGGERETPPAQFVQSLTLERVLREEFHRLSGRGRHDSHTVRRMTEDFEAALDRQPEGRKALRELVALLPHLVVVTVNFDRLIETDLGVPSEVLVTPKDFARGPDLVRSRLGPGSGALPILKIHGSIEDPESLVANVDDTGRGLSTAVTTTLDALVEDDLPRTWIWLGCSMRDIDVNIWAAAKSGATDLQEWWVDPLPPPTVDSYASMRTTEWASVDVDLERRQITATADRFLVSLLEHARALPNVN